MSDRIKHFPPRPGEEENILSSIILQKVKDF